MRPTSRILVEKAILTQILSLINILILLLLLNVMETFTQNFMNMRMIKVTLFMKNLFRTYFAFLTPPQPSLKGGKTKMLRFSFYPDYPSYWFIQWLKLVSQKLVIPQTWMDRYSGRQRDKRTDTDSQTTGQTDEQNSVKQCLLTFNIEF